MFFPIVAVAAFTGARRNEILGLRWTDLDAAKRTLRIERAVERTRKHGLALKEPKNKRHKRTIEIAPDLVALLVAGREKHLHIAAGIPDGVLDVDLSLVKLPDCALMFPNPPQPGEQFSFTALRGPDNVTKEFTGRAAKLGFARLRLHDLRSTHETMLLDRGVPVHVVAARLTPPCCCGPTPSARPRLTPAPATRSANCRPASWRRGSGSKRGFGSKLGPSPCPVAKAFRLRYVQALEVATLERWPSGLRHQS